MKVKERWIGFERTDYPIVNFFRPLADLVHITEVVISSGNCLGDRESCWKKAWMLARVKDTGKGLRRALFFGDSVFEVELTDLSISFI